MGRNFGSMIYSLVQGELYQAQRHNYKDLLDGVNHYLLKSYCKTAAMLSWGCRFARGDY